MNKVIMLVSTVVERENLLNFLDQFDQRIFNESISPDDLLQSGAPEKFRESLKEYFSNEIESGQVEALFAKCKELRSQLKNISKITLTIACDPTDETVQSVRQFFQDTDKPVLIEFLKDLLIVGGAVIESNGRIFEQSFRVYFEKRREERRGL